jgi:poly(3-hydroxybutyrate) depolymerase
MSSVGPTNRISGPNRMSQFEFGWLVGILEGEGCFFVTTRSKGGSGPYAYAQVTVCMTDRDIIERLRRVTGIGTLEKIRERKNPEHKPISQWIVCRHQEAIELMVAVYPHMGTRRQAKIREVLAQVEKRAA